MESAMGDTEDLYFLRFEHRPLTPEQWDRVKRSVVRGAGEHRAQMLRSLFVAILTSPRRVAKLVAAAVGQSWRAYATWRERRQAIKELGGLDDRVLKDMGLHRSEIESVVYGSNAGRPPEGTVAPVLLHKPCAKQSAAVRGAPKQLIERTAA
jgi:uncharacterized protein YjiS (DUF1127 family)